MSRSTASYIYMNDISILGPLFEGRHAALLAKAEARTVSAAVDLSMRRRRANLTEEQFTASRNEFVVVTFYTEGKPHDSGLRLKSQMERLRTALTPHCTRFLAFTLRQVRSMVLHDGTRCASLARDLRAEAAAAAKLGGAPPNAGYAAIGYGGARPCFLLHVLEQMREGSVLLYLDVNVKKHWNLAALPHHAEGTARWLLTHGTMSITGCEAAWRVREIVWIL